jgi:hypothetical protein
MSEREHAADCGAFASAVEAQPTPWLILSNVAGARPHHRRRPIGRTPELHRSPRTGICEKEVATTAGSRSAAQAAPAGRSASRRSPRARVWVTKMVNASGRIVVRSDRPSSIVAPNRNITKVEIGDVGQQPQRRPGQVEQHRAAEAKMRRAGRVAF